VAEHQDRGQSVLVVARGRVKIKFIGPEEQGTFLALVWPGELFGELALWPPWTGCGAFAKTHSRASDLVECKLPHSDGRVPPLS
jgi:hypothetical protein